MAETGPLTKAEIEQWRDIDERRKAADRLKSALEKQQKPLSDKIAAYIRDKGGSDRTTVHYGYVLAFGQRQSQPSWLTEFIALKGIEESERLKKAAPWNDYVIITPAAP